MEMISWNKMKFLKMEIFLSGHAQTTTLTHGHHNDQKVAPLFKRRRDWKTALSHKINIHK